MPDFWKDSGYALTGRTADNRLTATPDLWRAYLMRPELAPIDESCDSERQLHDALMKNPMQAVSDDRLGQLADSDAADNYRIFLGFRDKVSSAGSLEAAYASLFDGGAIRVPPIFIDQLAALIVRHILGKDAAPLEARAGELLFRSQNVTLVEGQVMVADEEIVQTYATSGGFGNLGRLIAEAQTEMRSISLDVLDESNADIYWERAERHDTVLNLTFGSAGLDALCRVLEKWVGHFLAVDVSIQPVRRISDKSWVWYIGFDAEANRLLTTLYNGAELDEAELERILSLFRLEFRDPLVMRSDIAGKPVYCAIAMTSGKLLRMKPQNLLTNLPISANS
jgi:hypothetical protein